MDIYFRYLFFLAASLAATYLAGIAVEKVFRIRFGSFFTSLFARFLTGAVLVVVVVSVIITKGKTVNLVMVLAAFVFGLYKRFSGEPVFVAEQAAVEKTKWFNITALGLVVLLVFTFRFSLIYNPGGVLLLPNLDTLFHANVSGFIWWAGHENISLDYLGMIPQRNDPYHYFDLWFNSAWFHIFKLNSLICYILVTVTVFITIIWTGFMAIASHFRMIRGYSHILAFTFIFFSGVYFPFYKEISWLSGANIFAVDAINYNKLAVIVIFMQASILFFLNRKQVHGTWMLLLIPAAYISTSAGIFGAVSLFLVYDFFKGKDIRKLAWIAGMALMTVCFFFLFYKSNQSGQTIRIREMEGGFAAFLKWPYLVTCMNILGLTCLQLVVIYLPALILLLPFIRYIRQAFTKTVIHYLVLACLVFSASLGAWAALHYMVDTVQLFSNVSIVMINLLFFLAFVFLSTRLGSLPRKILLGAVVVLFLYKASVSYSYGRSEWKESDQYLIETSRVLKKINPVGVYLQNDSAYTHIFSKNPIHNIAGRHLAYASNNAFTYTMSVFSIPSSSGQEETVLQLKERSVFYQFVEKQRHEGTFSGLPEAQRDFIEQYKIDYLIAERGAELHLLLEQMVKSEIYDPNTGTRFFLLNRNR